MADKKRFRAPWILIPPCLAILVSMLSGRINPPSKFPFDELNYLVLEKALTSCEKKVGVEIRWCQVDSKQIPKGEDISRYLLDHGWKSTSTSYSYGNSITLAEYVKAKHYIAITKNGNSLTLRFYVYGNQ